MTPSNANTSGLEACAQEEADTLASKLTNAEIIAASWKDRATAAEARADRLAKGMPDLSSVIGWLANGCDPTHAVTELRILQARINHALQQETQP